MSWRPWVQYRSRPEAGEPGATPPRRSSTTAAATRSPTRTGPLAPSPTTQASGLTSSESGRPSSVSRPRTGRRVHP